MSTGYGKMSAQFEYVICTFHVFIFRFYVELIELLILNSLHVLVVNLNCIHLLLYSTSEFHVWPKHKGKKTHKNTLKRMQQQSYKSKQVDSHQMHAKTQHVVTYSILNKHFELKHLSMNELSPGRVHWIADNNRIHYL